MTVIELRPKKKPSTIEELELELDLAVVAFEVAVDNMEKSIRIAESSITDAELAEIRLIKILDELDRLDPLV
jgi:hypothetical protein